MSVYECLKELGINIGDKIEVRGIKGFLMPKTEFSDENIVVLKLENGYNIGLRVDSCEEIKIIKKDEKKDSKIQTNLQLINEFSNELPIVSILACGGTIASKIEYKTGAVYPS